LSDSRESYPPGCAKSHFKGLRKSKTSPIVQPELGALPQPHSLRVVVVWPDLGMTSNRENCCHEFDQWFPSVTRSLFVSPISTPPLDTSTAAQVGRVRCNQAPAPRCPTRLSCIVRHQVPCFHNFPLPLILGKQVTLPVNTNPAATTDHRCTGHRARSATIEYAANTIRRLPHRSSQGKASRPSVPQTSDLTTEFIRSLGLDAVPGYGPCARV